MADNRVDQGLHGSKPRMRPGSGKSRYAKKQRGEIETVKQTNNWCRGCLSPHCHCDVDTSQHFQLTDDEVQEWYR